MLVEINNKLNKYAKGKKIKTKSDSKAKVLMQLSEQEYTQVRPIGAQRPRFYGLPKIHITQA